MLVLRPRARHLGRMQQPVSQPPLDELRTIALRHGRDGGVASPLPRTAVLLGCCPTKPLPSVYKPMMCFVLQGAKRVTIGDRTLVYRGPCSLIASVDLPATGQVIEANAEAPYLGIALDLDPATIAAILLDLPALPEGEPSIGMVVGALGPDLLDPLVRLARLFDRPADAPVLAPMCERELLYRLLLGPQGALLRQIAHGDSRLSQIRRAVAVIRARFAETLRIEELADLAGMSLSTFHRHFKAVTALTPHQYQKQIRLQEARHLMLVERLEAARVAYAVGYESASQFSREYARLFGLPPARDAIRLRQGAGLEQA